MILTLHFSYDKLPATLLEHLARDAGGHTDEVLHYKLTRLNHLIDVAAYYPPEIRQLGLTSSALLTRQ